MKKKLNLYGVKMFFTWKRKIPVAESLIEERVLLFKCSDEKALAKLVAKELKVYSRRDQKTDADPTSFKIRGLSKKYLVYRISAEERDDNPLEVYSGLHRNKQPNRAFLKDHLL